MHIIASCLVDAIFHANPIYNMNQVFEKTLAKRRNKRRSTCHLLLSAPFCQLIFCSLEKIVLVKAESATVVEGQTHKPREKRSQVSASQK